MILIPNPLHPAVVHFPIVLLLLGALAGIAAVFWRRHQLPALAAVLLALGALGAWVAVETGESDGGLLENGPSVRETLVDEHETWAKRTLALGSVAAVLAIGSALVGRWPRPARAVALLAALASLAAVFAVYETGHRGGELVYRHAAGVQIVAAAPNDTPTAGQPTRPRAGGGGEDKD